MGERVIIALDNYDDIFSDFDIGPYETRLISADFIDELEKKTKKITPEKIILTLPSSQRDKTKEGIIQKRLKEFFKNKYIAKNKKIKDAFVNGSILIIIGIFIFLLVLYFEKHIAAIYDYAIFPTWYISWRGLDKIFSIFKLIGEKEYFTKLQKAHIIFEDEEKYSEKELSKETIKESRESKEIKEGNKAN
jgi:hypothetical protein